jgi:hypothetical protein
VHSRLADIRRRCRRIASQLVWLGVVVLCTSGGHHAPAAEVVPPAFAIAELDVRPAEPPHVTVAPAPSITVRVVARGEPVAGAEVSISDGSKPLIARARTDRDGVAHFAELEPGAYELWAAHGERASAIARVMDVPPDSRIEIALDRPAGTLHGRIVTDGEPPREASVQLVPLDLDHATRVGVADARRASRSASCRRSPTAMVRSRSSARSRACSRRRAKAGAASSSCG